MKALILNDTRRGRHMGCIIVMQQLQAQCAAAGIEITAMLRLGRRFQARLEAGLADCDLLIINGEGTMHHDAPGALMLARAGARAAERGIPIALVNTVWQDNVAANDLLRHCRWIATRESLSQAAVALTGRAAQVVPDLTLCSDPQSLFGEAASTPGHGIVVMDDVRFDLSMALLRWARARGFHYRPMGERPSLRTREGWSRWLRAGLESGWAQQFNVGQLHEVARAELLVTGRYHGVCLALLARRPFLAFASNTHKIEGLLRDAGLQTGLFLCADPPGDAAARNAFIDAAVQRLQAALAEPGQRERYVAACERYTARAVADATSLFSAMGSGRDVKGCTGPDKP